MKLERLLFSIAAMMLLLPLAAQEKEQSDMRFGKHLTLGGEIGTMGIGLEVATPLHPNIRLRAGIVALPFALREHYVQGVDLVSMKGNSYDYMAAQNTEILQALSEAGLPLTSSGMPETVDMEEKLRRIEGKLLLDFYPEANGCFYVSLGVYVGGSHQRKVQGDVEPMYARAVEMANVYLPADDQLEYFMYDEQHAYYTYKVGVPSSGKISYSRRILPVKPYVGIGFGRMLPKRKLGCHFDLGVLYRGRWKVDSDTPFAEYVDYPYKWASIYCVAALRLTGQLF